MAGSQYESYDCGWLLKTDSEGNELWRKIFGGDGQDIIHSAQIASDGGYVLAGMTTSWCNYDIRRCDYAAWLIKVASG